MRRNSLGKLASVSTSILLAATLLSACGGNSTTSSSNNNVKPTPTTNNQPQPSDNTSTTTNTTNTTTTDTASKDIVTLNLFVDQAWWPFKDFSGSVTDEITKRTGVKLNITVATDEKQLPVMIASGSLPDLVATSSQYKRLADPQLSYAWDDLIAKYDPSFVIDPERIGVNKAPDGKFYTIRNNFSTKAEWEANKKYALFYGAGIAYRTDIMEEIGNPKLETLDDLINVYQLVKDKHKDMLPLVLNPYWSKPYFAAQFGVEGGFADVDGTLKHSLHTQNYKDMYLYMNELYRKGFVTAENYAYKSEEQTRELATSGKAFSYTWTTSGADQLTALSKEKGYTFKNMPVKISDQFKHVKTDTGWMGVFITKGNKHPDASIKLMDFLASEEGQRLTLWGIEGQDWNMASDGNYPVFTYDHLNEDIRKEKGAYYWGLLIGSAATELAGNYVPGTDTTKTNQDVTALTTFNPAIGLIVPDADSKQQVIQTNIDNMVKNEESKVLLAKSKEAASKAYDDMVAKADKLGLKDLEAWAQGKYAEAQKQFK